MSKTVNSKILVRRDTSTNWSTNNPILAAGEIGFDTTVGKHKIGDGSTAWNSLPYFLLETGDAHRTLAIPYAEVDSTSTSTVFTATVNGITELYDGVCVYLKNGVISSASGWTLNINNLGAKPVYQSQAAASRTTTIFNVAYTGLFIYNSTRVAGGCWDYFYGYNSDTNTIAYQIRNYQSSLVMHAALTRYKICFSRFDDTILPSTAVSNSTGTTKTLTTESFNPFGPIYYYSTTTGVGVGESPSASYMWMQYHTIDLRYSFNAGSTLIAKDAVYIKCVPQSDGSFKLAGDNCIVQTLPSTEDGYVYLHLGKAYSTYQIALDSIHPGYYYKDGIIKLWTNQTQENFLVEITGTYDDQTEEMDYVISNGVTYSNIVDAIVAKKNIIAILTQNNEDKQNYYFCYYNYDNSNQPIVFTSSSFGTISCLEIASNNGVSISHEYDFEDFEKAHLIGTVGISGTTATFSGISKSALYQAYINRIPVFYESIQGEGSSEYVMYQLVYSAADYYGRIFYFLNMSFGGVLKRIVVDLSRSDIQSEDDTFTGTYSTITIPTVPTNVSAFTNDAGYITSSSLPTNVSDLTNDVGYLTSYTETDPTVPAWAKASTKPTYTANQVGAAPSNHAHTSIQYVSGSTKREVKTEANNISFSFTDVSGSDTVKTHILTMTHGADGVFINNLQAGTADTSAVNKKYVDDTIATVPSWAMQSTKPTYTANQVGAMSTSHAANAITAQDITNWNNKPSTDTNTTYTISMSSNRITLTPSSGTASYIDLPIYNGGVTDVWAGGDY